MIAGVQRLGIVIRRALRESDVWDEWQQRPRARLNAALIAVLRMGVGSGSAKIGR